MKRILVFTFLLLTACGPDPIPTPEAVVLLAPANLNNCTTATRVSDLERQVRFQWAAAFYTDRYELIVENSLTRRKLTSETALLSESVILPSGAPYQWYVISKSTLTAATTKSSVWQFYLEGNPETTYIPFPAILMEPSNNEEVTLNTARTYTFRWQGNDLDGDIVSYDFYLGLSENELNKEREDLVVSENTEVLNSETLYFWRVVSIDGEGNKSSSETFQFQTL